MASSVFCEHPLLGSLSAEARERVAFWCYQQARATPDPDPEGVLRELERILWDDSVASRRLAPERLEEIQGWWGAADEELLLRPLVEEALRLAQRDRAYPLATPEQIAIIQEAMEEVHIYFPEAQLMELTRNQADAIIKGIMVRSEIYRLTGSYEYQIRWLRQAIRLEHALRAGGGWQRLCDGCGRNLELLMRGTQRVKRFFAASPHPR